MFLRLDPYCLPDAGRPAPRKIVTMKPPIWGRELYLSEISVSAEEEDLRKLFVLFGTVN